MSDELRELRIIVEVLRKHVASLRATNRRLYEENRHHREQRDRALACIRQQGIKAITRLDLVAKTLKERPKESG